MRRESGRKMTKVGYRRIPPALVPLVGAAIINAILASCGGSALESPSPGTGWTGGGERSSGQPGNQVELQTSIVSDREHLFRGVVSYFPLNPMPVDGTQE